MRHKDGLKKLATGDYDGAVFDDFNVSHWPRECAIHLTDLENTTQIDVKHGMATIEKGFPRVFCSNVPIFPADCAKAIERRVYCLIVRKDLRDMTGVVKGKDKPSDDWAEAMAALQDIPHDDGMPTYAGFTYRD